MNKTSRFYLALRVFSVAMILSVCFSVQAAAQEVAQRDFPSLFITSERHPFLQPREYWHGGTLSLTSENPEWNFSNVDVRLRGRGNSTWVDAPGKRPLRIRFETPQGMFGSAAHRDWILLANAFDGSLLRTHFTFYFAVMLGDTTNYVPSTQFVHLYINGAYVGVYQLTDERDNGPGRGNVRVDSNPAISEYWLEMDMRTTDYFSINRLNYDFRMPSGSALTDAHINYAREFLVSVSDAIRVQDWDRITALIDVQSFVDFYIVQEWSKELDVFISSVFMQIRGQGEERRLVMGPFWDFDNSFGNFNKELWGVRNGPVGDLWAQRHYWFRNLMRVQQFRDKVTERWIGTAWAREAALENLDYMVRVYGRAFERNFQVQPMFAGEWGRTRSPYILAAGSNWLSQVEYLVYFARTRGAWLDGYFIHDDPPRFADVRSTDWFYNHVMTVYNAGIFEPTSPNTFAPSASVTRGMFAQVLFNLSEGATSAWVQNQNVELTREELVVLLHDFALEHGMQFTGDRGYVFRDIANLSAHSQNAINAMQRAAIVSGTSAGLFSPHALVSRAEAAVMVARLMRVMDF